MKLWLEKGREDLLVAEMVLGAPMHSYDIVSFHAQQAAEKSLKAVLIRYQVPFGKTHDIRQLLSLVEPVAPGLRENVRGRSADALRGRFPVSGCGARGESRRSQSPPGSRPPGRRRGQRALEALSRRWPSRLTAFDLRAGGNGNRRLARGDLLTAPGGYSLRRSG